MRIIKEELPIVKWVSDQPAECKCKFATLGAASFYSNWLMFEQESEKREKDKEKTQKLAFETLPPMYSCLHPGVLGDLGLALESQSR